MDDGDEIRHGIITWVFRKVYIFREVGFLDWNKLERLSHLTKNLYSLQYWFKGLFYFVLNFHFRKNSDNSNLKKNSKVKIFKNIWKQEVIHFEKRGDWNCRIWWERTRPNHWSCRGWPWSSERIRTDWRNYPATNPSRLSKEFNSRWEGPSAGWTG